MAVLPPADRSAKAWLDALKPSDPQEDGDVPREDRDVGGGARRVEVALYGGYATTYVRAVIREDRVVMLRADCPLQDYDRDSGVDVALKAAWGKVPVTSDTGGLHYEWSEPSRVRAHREAIEKAFGCRGEVQVPPGLRASFDLLDGALSDLVHGTMCGEGGEPPLGREALDALVGARATPLLRALLRSPNPEGRVYAVEGLERLAKTGERASTADAAAIEAIRASPVEIQVCAGCEHSSAKAAEALRRRADDVEEPAK